jgi:hypothetical protein
VFDVFLMEGSRVLHQVGLGLIKLNEQAILACQSLEDCFILMKFLPSRTVDADKLIKVSLKEIQIQPKAKLRSLKLSHCKQFEEIKRQNVFAELKQSTECEQLTSPPSLALPLPYSLHSSYSQFIPLFYLHRF